MDRSYSEIVPLRTPGRNPPLFCIGNFQPMAEAMEVDKAIYGLRWVNLDSAAAPLSLEELAAAHVEQVCKVQERGPYQLIGYSFGGLVAYAMATQLANSGRDVGLLALVDTLNPWFYHNLSPAEARQFRKTYLADRIKKYSKNLIQGKFGRIGSDTSELIIRKIKPLVRRLTQRQSQLLDLSSMSTSPTVHDIVRSYAAKEFGGRIVLFRVEKAMDAGSELDADPSLGWQKYASKGVDIQYLPGGHATVLQMPNVTILADKVAPYLADLKADSK